jgi:hypothetical protein
MFFIKKRKKYFHYFIRTSLDLRESIIYIVCKSKTKRGEADMMKKHGNDWFFEPCTKEELDELFPDEHTNYFGAPEVVVNFLEGVE